MSSDNQALLAWLDPDRARAEEKYLHLRRALIEYFSRRRCFDPENLADEVFVRILNNIQKGDEIKKDDPFPFAYGVARRVYFEYVRKDIRNQQVAAELPSSPPPSGDTDECFRVCLNILDPEEREILERWFLDKDDKLLDEELGITRNALRIKIYRLKKTLEACYDRCKSDQTG